MEFREIVIVDSGLEKYSQKSSNKILGRKYDNEAVAIKVVMPDSDVENGSKCFMIVTNKYGVVLDHIDVTGKIPPIRQHISRFDSILIGFYFSRADGYIKNCEFLEYGFAPALDPNSTVDVTPEQKQNIDIIASYAFVSVDWKEDGNNTLVFKKANGEVSKEIDLNDFATKEFVRLNGGKIDSISINGVKQEIDENKNIDLKGLATENFVKEKVKEVVGFAPEDLDTLEETANKIVENQQKVEEALKNAKQFTAGEGLKLSEEGEFSIKPATERYFGGLRVWEDEDGYLCFATEDWVAFKNKLENGVLTINGAYSATFSNGTLVVE